MTRYPEAYGYLKGAIGMFLDGTIDKERLRRAVDEAQALAESGPCDPGCVGVDNVSPAVMQPGDIGDMHPEPMRRKCSGCGSVYEPMRPTESEKP